MGESYKTESDSAKIIISDVVTHLEKNEFVGIWSDMPRVKWIHTFDSKILKAGMI